MARRSRKSTLGSHSRYTPPHHYTGEELLDADIADLESDLRCAIRDGHLDYAKQVEAELNAKLAQRGSRPSTIPTYSGGGKRRKPLLATRSCVFCGRPMDASTWKIHPVCVECGYKAQKRAAGGKKRHANRPSLGKQIAVVNALLRK